MIKLKEILNESKFWVREFGDPLPTFNDVMGKHQLKEGFNFRKIRSKLEYEYDWDYVEQEGRDRIRFDWKRGRESMWVNDDGSVEGDVPRDSGLKRQMKKLGIKESVNESDLGLTYKRGKTVKVTHKKSGKELIIIDKPNVKREYEKIGYFAEGTVNEINQSQAKILLKQLGGGKFIAMTGAKDFGIGKDGLHFKIGRNSKGVSHVRINYSRGRDLYDMAFLAVRMGKVKIKKQIKGVYADQLGEIFERYTGLYVRL